MKTKLNKSHLLSLLALVCLGVIAFVFRGTPATVEEGFQPQVYTSVLSLLPPVIAIVLALITKEVYSSLFIGIVVGGLLYSNGNLELAFNTVLYDEEGGLVSNIANSSHASILFFVVLLGALVVLMNRSGSAEAFGKWASKHIKTRVGAQIATAILGLLIFVDDGFNCYTVGLVMRPITDEQKVSRSKLAYLIDSTAAPICIIAPISSWAAAVSYSVPESMDVNPFQLFLKTIPYNMYALVTIAFVFMISAMKFDFGPMRRHELNALKGDLFSTDDMPYEDKLETEVNTKDAKVSNLVIPVILLIVSCIIGMVYTGGFFSGASFSEAFANADSARGLVMGATFTTVVTFFFYLSRGVVTFKEFFDSLPAGFRSFCQPMIILIMAWSLGGITGMLGAGEFIREIMDKSAQSLQMFLPFIIFAVSVGLAFASGTSWGTFTILIPIVCNVFPAGNQYEMLTISIAACLAGAVCGDHCSPISDTTIMSSAGAKCNHINHVSSQLPYALTSAGISAVGFLIAGIIGFYTENSLAILATPITILLTFAVLALVRKKVGKLETA